MTDMPAYGDLGTQLQGHAQGLFNPAAQPTLGAPGTMPMQVGGLLPTTGPAVVALTDALPGSKIAVFNAPAFGHGERCTVIKMDPEWGPNHVPALHLVSDSSGERKLLTESMAGARIEILLSAEVLGIEQIPDGAVRARTRPIDVVAFRWEGDAEGAAKLIMWAAKYASLRYVEEDGVQAAYMVISKLDAAAEEFIQPGDYLIKDPDGEFRVLEVGAYKRQYEEVDLFG